MSGRQADFVVSDAASGERVANAHIQTGRSFKFDPQTPTARTDEHGRARMKVVARDLVRLEVSAFGYEDFWCWVRGPTLAPEGRKSRDNTPLLPRRGEWQSGASFEVELQRAEYPTVLIRVPGNFTGLLVAAGYRSPVALAEQASPWVFPAQLSSGGFVAVPNWLGQYHKPMRVLFIDRRQVEVEFACMVRIDDFAHDSVELGGKAIYWVGQDFWWPVVVRLAYGRIDAAGPRPVADHGVLKAWVEAAQAASEPLQLDDLKRTTRAVHAARSTSETGEP